MCMHVAQLRSLHSSAFLNDTVLFLQHLRCFTWYILLKSTQFPQMIPFLMFNQDVGVHNGKHYIPAKYPFFKILRCHLGISFVLFFPKKNVKEDSTLNDSKQNKHLHLCVRKAVSATP